MRYLHSFCLLSLLLVCFVFKESMQQCSSILTLTASDDDVGVIQSSNHPSSYSNNMRCAWLISTDVNKKVVINIRDFNLESRYDFLYIYDGSSTSGTLLAQRSGQYTSPVIFSSTGNNLYLRFTTDTSVTRSGFKLTYFSIWDSSPNLISLNCNSGSSPTIQLTSVRKTVALSTFPSKYNGNCACTATITFTSSSARLTVLLADYDFSSPDGLTIRDGNAVEQLLVPNYDTIGYGSVTVEITTPNATLEFRGESYTQYTGFVISAISTSFSNTMSYTVPTSVPVYSTCRATFSASNETIGTLLSPNFPLNYDNNLDCGWIIDSQSSSFSIQINMIAIDTEHCCDFLTIYDGNSNMYDTVANLRGSPTLSTYTTSGQYAYIYFHSDGSIINTGFQLTYQAVPSVTPTCSLSSYISLVPSSSRQVFASHGNQGNYYNNLDTYWLITKPSETQTVQFYLEEFATEVSSTCRYDYLKIYNGACTSNDLWITLCGSKSDQCYHHSYGKYILLHFHTDGSVTSEGFRIQYYIGSSTLCSTDQSSETGASEYKEEEAFNTKIIGYTIGPAIIITTIVVIVVCCARSAKNRSVSNPIKKNALIISNTKTAARQAPKQAVQRVKKTSIKPVPVPVHPSSNIFVPPDDPAYPPVATVQSSYYGDIINTTTHNGSYNTPQSYDQTTDYTPLYSNVNVTVPQQSSIPCPFEYKSPFS